MPLTTNPNFDAKNLEAVKLPLYMLLIDGVPEALTTFRADIAQVGLAGYGIGGYGVLGYGY